MSSYIRGQYGCFKQKHNLTKITRERFNMADEQDKKSIHETVEQFYKIISGEKGDQRDWGKFRALFLSEDSIVSSY